MTFVEKEMELVKFIQDVMNDDNTIANATSYYAGNDRIRVEIHRDHKENWKKLAAWCIEHDWCIISTPMLTCTIIRPM